MRSWDHEIMRSWDHEIMRWCDDETMRWFDDEMMRWYDDEMLRWWDDEIMRPWDHQRWKMIDEQRENVMIPRGFFPQIIADIGSPSLPLLVATLGWYFHTHRKIGMRTLTKQSLGLGQRSRSKYRSRSGSRSEQARLYHIWKIYVWMHLCNARMTWRYNKNLLDQTLAPLIDDDVSMRWCQKMPISEDEPCHSSVWRGEMREQSRGEGRRW